MWSGYRTMTSISSIYHGPSPLSWREVCWVEFQSKCRLSNQLAVREWRVSNSSLFFAGYPCHVRSIWRHERMLPRRKWCCPQRGIRRSKSRSSRPRYAGLGRAAVHSKGLASKCMFETPWQLFTTECSYDTLCLHYGHSFSVNMRSV